MAFLKLEFGDLHPDPDLEGKLLKESSAWDIRPENGAYAYKYAGLTEYSDSKIFLILRDFLQDPNTDRSFETIVKEILELIPENAQQSTEVWCLSEVFWYLAEQIPYHHPSQIKLVQVVEELSRSVKITVKDYGPKNKGKYFPFPRFHESLIMEAYGGELPSPTKPSAWPNFHAFIAHLEDCHIWQTSPHWAIYAMQQAFENDPNEVFEEYRFEGAEDQKVLAAAQYILWNGQSLLKQVMYLSDEELSELKRCRPGPLYGEGKPFYSFDRWNFWKKGFQAAAEDNSTFGDECRSVSRKVVSLMNSLEHSMLF